MLAHMHGFEGPKSKDRYSSFDLKVARYLGKSKVLAGGEALHDDTWSFIGVAVLPDVAHWRFPKKNEARYLGGLRNTFQRLWTRARALDRGEGEEDRWELLDYLNEDAAVAIFERPSIGGDPILARAVVEARKRYMLAAGARGIERITRLAVMKIRIMGGVRSWWLLSSGELVEEFGVIFAEAGKAIMAQPAPGALRNTA